jgi:hypothetical protein
MPVLALVAAVALALFAGCGGGDTTSTAETAPEAASQAIEGETPSQAVAGEVTDAGRPGALRLYRHEDPIVWVRRGERTEVLSEPGGELVRRVGDETEFGSPTVFAVEKKEGPWAGVLTPYRANGELGWVRLDAARLRAGYTGTSAQVDLSDYETTVLDSGGKVLRRFRVTVGAPGSTTPTGLFAVTDTFKGDLNPSYGCCAVALTANQPSLPSGWLGGNRIAFHGTDGPLGVAASHGCIRAANPDVEALLAKLPLGARVEIRQ